MKKATKKPTKYRKPRNCSACNRWPLWPWVQGETLAHTLNHIKNWFHPRAPLRTREEIDAILALCDRQLKIETTMMMYIEPKDPHDYTTWNTVFHATVTHRDEVERRPRRLNYEQQMNLTFEKWVRGSQK